MTSREAEEVRAFLILNRLRIEGRRKVVQLLSEGQSAPEIAARMESEDLLKELPVPESAGPFSAEKESERCAQKGIRFLLFSDPEYPPGLKEIADPPLLLYMKGNILESDRNAIAIVGTRHPGFYGRTQAKRFARELAARGLTIVSGLARGIDQVGHEAALQVAYGRTIAVMGCGLDVVYPKEHETLFQRITERGAVLSEYPLGTPPLPENFPRRNRILSGLSYATFVVEAHSRSGSLITAHQAVEQGREVFALPGPVDQLTSRGTHQLIKEGACLVEAPEDILLVLADRLRWENRFETSLVTPHGEETGNNVQRTLVHGQPMGGEEMKPERGEDRLLGDIRAIPHEDESVILELLKEEGPQGPDEILEFTGLESAKLPMLLLRLELLKKITRTQEGKYLLGSTVNGQRSTER